jgi:hypothetical protein
MTEISRRRARRWFAVAATCAAALHAAPALAAPDQQSLIEDETLMLNPATQAASLDEAKALGADIIRANVIWARYAPDSSKTKKPKKFDGKNSNAYPAGTFAALDSFVAGAQARGMQVLLTGRFPRGLRSARGRSRPGAPASRIRRSSGRSCARSAAAIRPSSTGRSGTSRTSRRG